MTYLEKLKDPRWQKKRLSILERDNFTCQMCTDDKTELQVHHKNYTGEPWDAPDEDLITFCAHCHKAETELNKTGDKIIFAMKTDTNYFAKTHKRNLIIGSIQADNSLHVSLKVHRPKEFSSIILNLIS